VCCVFPRFQHYRLLQIEAAWSSVTLSQFCHTKSLHIPAAVILFPIYLTARHRMQLALILPTYLPRYTALYIARCNVVTYLPNYTSPYTSRFNSVTYVPNYRLPCAAGYNLVACLPNYTSPYTAHFSVVTCLPIYTAPCPTSL